MAENEKNEVEARTEAAFARSVLLDPRDTFRARLKRLRDAQPAAFTAALQYYEQQLVPRITAGADPVVEWIEYGRKLGELTAPGKTSVIDETGRARPLQSAVVDQLILHLPSDTNVEALAVALPRQPSPAQQASYDLLIARARAL